MLLKMSKLQGNLHLQVDWAGSSTPNRHVNVWQVEPLQVEPLQVEPASKKLKTTDATADAAASSSAGSFQLFGKTITPDVAG